MVQNNLPIAFGSVQNPYREFVVTIPALGITDIDYAHNYFRALDLGGSGVGDVIIRFGESGGFTDLVGAGIGFGFEISVNKLTMRNTTASDVTVRIGLAMGKIDDSRFTVTGNITVINPIGQSLSVTDTASTELLTAYRGDNTGRKSLTPLVNTISLATNSTVTIASAVANTNGVVIHSLFINALGTSVGRFEIDGSRICNLYSGTSTTGANIWVFDLFIPAGKKVDLVSSGAGATVHAVYEVL